MSPEPPSGYTGDWWRIEPGVRTLMLRSVSDDWGAHRDPLPAIVRLDRPPRRARPAPDLLSTRLSALSPVVEGSLGFGIRKVASLRAAGTVNCVSLVDYSTGGGLPGQWYHEGLYDLGADDALLVEADLAGGGAFSLALTDGMGCTLDWANAQTSLNRTQADLGEDGRLRVVVARRDPGIANWLDTMGHRTGIMQFRWTGEAAPPAVAVRRLPVGALVGQFPDGTRRVSSAQRDALLRERAIGAQLRTRW